MRIANNRIIAARIAITVITIIWIVAIIPEVFSAQIILPPHQYYGNVTLNNKPAIDGLMVSAVYEDTIIAATETKNGQYGYDPLFMIIDTDGDLQGKDINFFIQGFNTGINTSFSNEDSAISHIDLNLSGYLFCGDNSCAGNENCATCNDDCGACESSNTGGGSSGSGSSGGGSGGSSGSSSSGSYTTSGSSDDATDQDKSETNPKDKEEDQCIPEWECSEWIDCISGKQKRTCIDLNRCSITTDKPQEERECNQSIIKINATGSNTYNINKEKDNNVPTGVMGITGNAIRSIESIDKKTAFQAVLVLFIIISSGLIISKKIAGFKK